MAKQNWKKLLTEGKALVKLANQAHRNSINKVEAIQRQIAKLEMQQEKQQKKENAAARSLAMKALALGERAYNLFKKEKEKKALARGKKAEKALLKKLGGKKLDADKLTTAEIANGFGACDGEDHTANLPQVPSKAWVHEECDIPWLLRKISKTFVKSGDSDPEILVNMSRDVIELLRKEFVKKYPWATVKPLIERTIDKQKIVHVEEEGDGGTEFEHGDPLALRLEFDVW